MSMIYRWILFIALFGISLSCSDHPKNSSSDMEPLDIVELRPADKWLKFPIDDDTDIGWYPTVIEKDEREYIIIKNSGMPQLLFYDVDKMECVRKITFQMEGPNAIGKAHRYYVKGWSEFYWLPPSAQQCLFKVDDAGVVQGRYDCSKDDAGNFLPPIESIVFIDSLVHIQLYHYNHNQQEEKTSVAAVLDTVHKVVKQFSFYHPSKPTMDDLYKGRLRAGDEYVSCLFDGANFVYVFGQNDSIYVATADHKNVKGYNAKQVLETSQIYSKTSLCCFK